MLNGAEGVGQLFSQVLEDAPQERNGRSTHAVDQGVPPNGSGNGAAARVPEKGERVK